MGAARACPTVRGDMGRIAEAGDVRVPQVHYRNKVDKILHDLDDDDRVIVLSWLQSLMPAEEVADRLRGHEYPVGETSVRHWRRMQRNGTGFSWG